MAEKRSQPPQHTSRTNHPSSSSRSSSLYQPPREHHLTKDAKPINYSNASTTNRNHISNEKNSGRSRNSTDDIEEETNLPTLIGACPFMCPVEERLQRERLRDLAVFERLHGNPGKSSPNLAVKKFCRTISTREVKTLEVRPLEVLEDTLSHLFALFQCVQHPFEVVHDFIFDRTRSIRQDLGMQNVINNQVITMYERMVKFHVFSHHKLRRSGNPNISSMLHLNLEQLTKSLMTLFDLYEANRTSESIYENEAEFRSLYVLLHIHPGNQGQSLSLWFRRVSSAIITSKEMCFARRILRYSRLGNYNRFMYILEAEASYLQYCIIEPYINEVRAFALCCLNHGGYKLQPFPLDDLSKLLVLQDSDVESFCNDCGLQASDETGVRCLPTKQTNFCQPKKGFQKYYPFGSERLQRVSVELSDL